MEIVKNLFMLRDFLKFLIVNKYLLDLFFILNVEYCICFLLLLNFFKLIFNFIWLDFVRLWIVLLFENKKGFKKGILKNFKENNWVGIRF